MIHCPLVLPFGPLKPRFYATSLLQSGAKQSSGGAPHDAPEADLRYQKQGEFWEALPQNMWKELGKIFLPGVMFPVMRDQFQEVFGARYCNRLMQVPLVLPLMGVLHELGF